jgi:hypothetical protein
MLALGIREMETVEIEIEKVFGNSSLSPTVKCRG